MTATAFSILFILALGVSLALGLWLDRRQIAHVTANRRAVPAAFAERIGLSAHQKAADYTVARMRFGIVETLFDALVLLLLTFGGGLAVLVAATGGIAQGSIARDLTLIVALGVVAGAVALPFSYFRTFVIEARFGFNRTTRALWFADIARGVLVAAVLGLPLAALILWLMHAAGAWWWIYAWLAWTVFQFLVLALYPTVIAPLFNKFSPLPDGPSRDAIEALLARCSFASRGLYVMDGSRRSSHGNAFFTGFGRARRIVFFDTLLERLAPAEIEAVLAHELGHFKLKHVLKTMVWSTTAALAFMALLAWLAASPWFYEGLGVPPATDRPGVALVLFVLTLPVFTFMLGPVRMLYSRKHEFEADAFAVQHASGDALAHALVKLYEDNASTLTPDPLYSAFHDSHPPAAVRIARLGELAPATVPAAAGA